MTEVSLSSEKENTLIETVTYGKESMLLGFTKQMLGYVKKIGQKLAMQRRAERKALKNGKIQTRGKGGRWMRKMAVNFHS